MNKVDRFVQLMDELDRTLPPSTEVRGAMANLMDAVLQDQAPQDQGPEDRAPLQAVAHGRCR